MMPLSSTDVQVLTLVNTPKLPPSLFDNAQPVRVSVLASNQNQATILLAGRQIQIQTTTPLALGKQFDVQPQLVNGQLQLKPIPTPISNTIAKTTPTPTQHITTGEILKLVSTSSPLPTNLFKQTQPISIRVLEASNTQATILLAGRQIQVQTSTPLNVGQELNVQPNVVDEQLELKLLAQNTKVQSKPIPLTQIAPPADGQILRVINRTTLPASLFEQAQPMSIRVLSAQANQATILLAGQTVSVQTTTTLAAGQNFTAQPELVNGTLQLKVSATNLTLPEKTTQQNTANASLNLPRWTDTLPQSAKEALGSMKQTLPMQTPLNELLRSVSQNLPELLSNTKDSKANAWQTLMNSALTTTPTAKEVQQSIHHFNAKLADHSQAAWKTALSNLIDNPNTTLNEKHIAQGILSKTEQTQQMQTLHQLAGQAVLLQEIPIQTQLGLDSFTLEIDVPKPDTPEESQQWKIFIQLELPEGDFTSRIQMDKDLNVRLQLWGSNEALSQSLQAQAQQLKRALEDQGLAVESLIVAQGKPQARTEQPAWQQPLIDVHG